jgi:hypothetical protein
MDARPVFFFRTPLAMIRQRKASALRLAVHDPVAQGFSLAPRGA